MLIFTVVVGALSCSKDKIQDRVGLSVPSCETALNKNGCEKTKVLIEPTYKNVVTHVLSKCGPCHLNGENQGDFNADTYEKTVLKVIPGNSDLSSLVFVIGPDGNMPPKGKGEPVAAEFVKLVSDWVDQGAQNNE